MADKNRGRTPHRRGPGRPFTKGVSGNPKGRPKGAKDRVPRGLVKSIVIGLIEDQDGKKSLIATLRKNLKDQDRAIRMTELAAKLNKEIGLEATTAETQVIINYHGPLDPKKFRAKTERHLKREPEEE